MPLSDAVAPTLKWLTVASGGLYTLGGIFTSLSFSPFDMFNGIFAFLFGLIIIGAQFNVEFILKQVAFIKTFWGKGVFFLYLGVPLLEIAISAATTNENDSSSTVDDQNPLAGHKELINMIVGVSLTANGLLNLVWFCTGAPTDGEDANADLSVPLAAQTGVARGSTAVAPTV